MHDVGGYQEVNLAFLLQGRVAVLFSSQYSIRDNIVLIHIKKNIGYINIRLYIFLNPAFFLFGKYTLYFKVLHFEIIKLYLKHEYVRSLDQH